MIENGTVPCGLCGAPTFMTSTKRCDHCWELERRVHANPELARRILADLETPTGEEGCEA